MKQTETANRQDEFLDFLTDHYPNIRIISTIESSQIFNKARRLFEEFRSPSPGFKLMTSIYSNIENLVLWARSEAIGYAVDLCRGVMEYQKRSLFMIIRYAGSSTSIMSAPIHSARSQNLIARNLMCWAGTKKK